MVLLQYVARIQVAIPGPSSLGHQVETSISGKLTNLLQMALK